MFSLQTLPSHNNLPAGVSKRIGHRFRERNRSLVAAAENYDDDRRVHRRQRGGEGADENVESPRDEVQLRGRLPDPTGLSNVPANEGQGTAREESIQELHAAHVFTPRLRAAQPGGFVPDGPDAQPNASG